MNAGHLRIALEHLAIFRFGIAPFALGFHGLGIQLVHLVRGGGRDQKLLRGANGEIGKNVDREIKHFGVPGKPLVEAAQKLESGVHIVKRHAAPHAVHAQALLRVRTSGFGPFRLQQRHGFPAMAGFGKLRRGLSGGGRRGQRTPKKKFH